MQNKEQVNHPLISVIIPFYNSAPYLNDTISSVIQQEYKNWEIILVDDGSTDGSAAIVNEWSCTYPDKIYCYHHPDHKNRGAAASRNLGVSKAKGNILAFLDSDDLWLPLYLEMQLTLLERYPDATVICEATKYWYSWNNTTLKDKIINIGATVDTLYTPTQLAKKLYPLNKGASFCTCALMMYTHSFRNLGGFDERFTGNNHLFEDQVLFLKICLQEKVFISSNCNNIYRQRNNSSMHSLRLYGDYANARFFFFQWLQSYINEKGIKDQQLNFLLKKVFLRYRYPFIFRVLDFSRHLKYKVKKVFFNTY